MARVDNLNGSSPNHFDFETTQRRDNSQQQDLRTKTRPLGSEGGKPCLPPYLTANAARTVDPQLAAFERSETEGVSG